MRRGDRPKKRPLASTLARLLARASTVSSLYSTLRVVEAAMAAGRLDACEYTALRHHHSRRLHQLTATTHAYGGAA